MNSITLCVITMCCFIIQAPQEIVSLFSGSRQVVYGFVPHCLQVCVCVCVVCVCVCVCVCACVCACVVCVCSVYSAQNGFEFINHYRPH